MALVYFFGVHAVVVVVADVVVVVALFILVVAESSAHIPAASQFLISSGSCHCVSPVSTCSK